MVTLFDDLMTFVDVFSAIFVAVIGSGWSGCDLLYKVQS